MPSTQEHSRIRTYESFAVQFPTSSWSGYRTEAEAQAVVDASTRPATIVRKTWDVEVPDGLEHLYQPGIAEVAS